MIEPIAATISKLDLGPDDVVVVQAGGHLTVQQSEALKAHVHKCLPAETRVLVLDSSVTLCVLNRAKAEDAAAKAV